MSKASEYKKAADIWRSNIAPSYSVPEMSASVTSGGIMDIWVKGGRYEIAPDIAIALAHWILDTFADGEEGKRI